jgi:hypothetical protein
MIRDKEELKNNIIIHNARMNPTESYFNEDVPKIEEYLNGMDPSHELWSENRATTLTKARSDSKCGKISEVFVDYFLKEFYGFPGGGVDYEIRVGKNKGWVSDLKYKEYPDFNFAVKGCPRLFDKKYSWVFQASNKNGRGGKDPIICKNNKEICFFVINLSFDDIQPHSEVRVFASAPIYMIYDIFKDPILMKHRGLKKCIYLQDLYNLKTILD